MAKRGELGSGPPCRARGGSLPAPRAARGAEGLRTALGAARRAAWAPILSRVAAGGLALVGLAAIGMAARKSPELTSLVPRSISVAGLAQLSGEVAPDADPAARAPATAALAPAPGAPPTVVSGVVSGVVSAAPGASSLSEPAAPPLAPMPSASPPTAAGSNRPCPTLDAAGQPPDPAPAGHDRARGAELARAAGPVVLNTADVRQLQRLPGVGAKRAQAIVELRERLGGFRQPSDLLRIRGIGRRLLERMAPHFVLGARSVPAGAATPAGATAPLTSRLGSQSLPPRSEAR